MPRNKSEKEQRLSREGLLALKGIRDASVSQQKEVTDYLRKRLATGGDVGESVWRHHWNAISDSLRWLLVELPLSERRRLYGVLSS